MIMTEIKYGYEVCIQTAKTKNLQTAPSGGLMREELLLISPGCTPRDDIIYSVPRRYLLYIKTQFKYEKQISKRLG